MKSRMIRLAVVMALLVSLFAVAAPPAMAATALSPNYGDISVSSGTVGTTVTISGSSSTDWLLNNVPLTVRWYASATSTSFVVLDTIPSVILTGKAGDSDPGSYSLSFKVPATTNGGHKVRLTDGINYADLAVFTVATKLKISPTSGTSGTEVTVTATGFSKNTGLTIYTSSDGTIDGTDKVVATLTTDANGGASGTFSGTATKYVLAKDGVGVTYTGTNVEYVLKAKIELTPDSGLVATKVEIKATKFDKTANGLHATTPVTFAGSVLTHEYTNQEGNLGVNEYIIKGGVTTQGTDDTASRVLPGTLASDGEFTLIIKLPVDAAAGANQIKVMTIGGGGPSTSNEAKANFTVDARTVTLTPSSGVKGSSVLVTVAGFSKSKTGGKLECTAYCTSYPVSLVANVETNAAGGAEMSFEVPDGFATGSNTIKFTDGNSNTATATFKVDKPAITLSPIEGAPGTTVSITGSAFSGNSLVTIEFTPVGSSTAVLVSTTPTTLITNSLGAFSASFILPASGKGTGTLTVKVSTDTKSKDFSVKKAVETVATVLAPIEGKYTIIWGYDGATQTWTKYDPSAPAVSDLAKLEKGQGYYIYATEATTLVWSSGVYNLYAGWNLIGWLG